MRKVNPNIGFMWWIPNSLAIRTRRPCGCGVIQKRWFIGLAIRCQFRLRCDKNRSTIMLVHYASASSLIHFPFVFWCSRLVVYSISSIAAPSLFSLWENIWGHYERSKPTDKKQLLVKINRAKFMALGVQKVVGFVGPPWPAAAAAGRKVYERLWQHPIMDICRLTNYP